MADLKVPLELLEWTSWHNAKIGRYPWPAKRALPYAHGRQRGKLHRVRSLTFHELNGRVHYSARLWCGTSVNPVHLMPAGTGYTLCGKCEEAAVLAGQPRALDLPRVQT